MEPYSDSLFALPPLSPTAKKAGRKKGKGSLILPHSYVIIDIETTGLYPARDAIIEIGIASLSAVITDNPEDDSI